MNARILIADDSPTMRKIIIRSLLAIEVKNIVEAGDGRQAWELFRRGRFDLVLTDWNMPGKTGLELVESIRSTGSLAPILLVTTEGERSRVLEALDVGVSDFLIKPFTAETLKSKLEKHLDIWTGAREWESN